MAAGKLTTRSGEVFVFCNDSLTSTSTITIKDAIASVNKLQEDVNSKLTEIINKEKGEIESKKREKMESNNEDSVEFEDDSDLEDKDNVNGIPPDKMKKHDEK